jgi:succinyl-diaminopimelate desuccinylase
MRTKLFDYIESNKKQAISLVSRLIEIPTVNPPGMNYEKIVDFLEKKCRGLDLKTKRISTPKKILQRHGIESGSKRISLVADWSIGAKKTLHINSHYDVVPVTGRWKTDPFKATIKGNRIYGRGSEDMKGNIACVLFAIEAMKRCCMLPRIDIQVSFTPDEETGGLTGLGYLIQNDLVKADYAMSEGHSGINVSMGNKGVLWAEVFVKGKASHASSPHRGVNAFERAVELAGEFKKLIKKISRRKTGYSMIDDISRKPTFVMGGILQGGIKVNIVPDTVRFSIDRRLIPEEKAMDAGNEIREVINRFNDKHRDSRVYVKFITKQNPAISRKDEFFFRCVSDAIKLTTGREARFNILPGATDMRYFMWKVVPALGYSARGGESWHSDNEFVYIDSVIDTAKVYALVMSTLT